MVTPARATVSNQNLNGKHWRRAAAAERARTKPPLDRICACSVIISHKLRSAESSRSSTGKQPTMQGKGDLNSSFPLAVPCVSSGARLEVPRTGSPVQWLKIKTFFSGRNERVMSQNFHLFVCVFASQPQSRDCRYTCAREHCILFWCFLSR